MSGAAPDDGPIRFRIRFAVEQQAAADFLRMLDEEYVPGLRMQPGFVSARVLLPYSAALNAEIDASGQPGVYELEFDFDSEGSRRDWVGQPVHDTLWNRAVALSTSQEWSGFHIHDDAKTPDGEKGGY